MLTFNYDRSFVAFAKCTTPGYEGYLDCAELAMKSGAPMRRAADWVTVTSFLGEEPHRFWFRCFEDGEGGQYYDIQSWSRKTGRDRNPSMHHTAMTNSGYMALYDAANALDQLWQVKIFDGEAVHPLPDPLALGEIASVEIITPQNASVCLYKREEVGHLWHCFVANSGGPVLTLTLEIVDLGEELLDDH
ncbi:hypothetical protein G3435_07375 [Pseudomonas sp. MAFF212428]|uniref:Uncharacterized protein n=1 Tax=Pseudomonas brassicae TaxID=2708063 RepID=A0A6B3NSN2_9PSED|nr:hypothetical protein [Pseudomonas brassicae]NER59848.1 hypothetical protein [Pseudomonas brassicae]NER63448.1 hypothetical protein [Pseudomonas brassicae]